MEKPQSPQRDVRRTPLALAATATLLAAALSTIWSFFAAQSPSSPYHLGPLVGPVETLARASWLAGVLGFALTGALPAMGLPEKRERLAVRLLAIGWAVLFAALLLGAVLGTAGTQLVESYPRSFAVICGKTAGFGTIAAGFISLCGGILKEKR